MGAASVSAIVNAKKKGKFKSLYDFTTRLDQGAVGRRGLEAITAGLSIRLSRKMKRSMAGAVIHGRRFSRTVESLGDKMRRTERFVRPGAAKPSLANNCR